MKAVQIKSYGDPLEVLEVVDVPEPKAPGANEALIGIELAALTKYDLLFISNASGGGPALPDHRGQRRVRACPGRRSRRRECQGWRSRAGTTAFPDLA